MRQLTSHEEQLLDRYLKVSQLHERHLLFRHARVSSNELLEIAADRYRQPNPSGYELTYLQGIARRMSKNYRKLRGLDGLIRFSATVRDATLADLDLGGG